MKQMRWVCILIMIAVLLCSCSSHKTEYVDSPEDMSKNETYETLSDSPSDLNPTGNQAAPTVPVDTDPLTTVQADPVNPSETDFVEEPQISAAFSALFPNCKALGLLYNEPFRLGELQATETWNRDDYDALFLIPRCVGTTVRAYAVAFDEEGKMSISDHAAYETVSGNGTVIAASLFRPEGGPAWYVEMTAPEGETGGMLLEYNGRTGTPQFEFINAVPAELSDTPEAELIGKEDYAAFCKAAEQMSLPVAEAEKLYDSRYMMIGDGAAFVRTVGGDMEDGACAVLCARFHQNYYTEYDDLEESVIDQYKLYGEIGNKNGILGSDFIGSLPDLYYELTGLTVYNRSLAAKQITILVNGEDVGTFTLSDGEICNLIPLRLAPMIADSPVKIEVSVVSTYYGKPADAIVEVFPGLGGNISNAL